MRRRELLGQPGEGFGGVPAGDDVLALAPGQVLPVRNPLSGERIASEEDSGAGPVVEVAEHHRLDGDRRPDVVGEVVVAAIGAGAP